ncbi:MAG: hypothetical protein ACOYN4_20585 [Bacteroidales bacterium]
MKTNVLILAFLTSLVAIAFAGCNFSIDQKEETVENAKTNLDAATADLEMARSDSAEYANFKLESELKLRENELLIADMKDKMKLERRESLTKYEKQLDSLDIQNTQLRNNMHLNRSENRAKWELFKQNFN